ncbi:MAG: hypothetical protein DWI00_10240 [Planctomycetota bacterium]|nr:MAG: hypothetical protein DWI00_10240 [Planctomycetota bacterium]
MTCEISRPEDGAISRDSECKKPEPRRKPGLAQLPLKNGPRSSGLSRKSLRLNPWPAGLVFFAHGLSATS